MSERTPIRLLIVTHSLSGGGAERFVSTLVRHLPRDRFEPQVCLATDRASYDMPADVPTVTLGYRGLHDLPRTLSSLRRILDRERPDLVLSNVLSTNCLTGGALGRSRHRPPWVARVGNAPEVADPPLQRFWARRVYPKAQRLVTNSRGMERALLRQYPGTEGKTTSIPNPTDFTRLDDRAGAEPAERRPEGGQVLLWLGRLVRQKRPDVALEALARIRREAPDRDVRLWLCGEGPLAGEARALASQLGLDGSVRFLGFVDNPFALMRQADLLLLTSDHEGLPNALIEAQGLGLPAVSTRCPYGPEEILHDGGGGRLVAPGDSRAVAHAALELLRDPERRRRMGQAAAERARARFGLSRVMPRWQELLERVVEEGR